MLMAGSISTLGVLTTAGRGEEMVVSALIVGFSLVLLAYWFRYTCKLALNAKREEDYAARVAAVNQLSFLETRETLQNGGSDLDPLAGALENDYRILRYLLGHSAGFGIRTLEQRLLLADYGMMRLWYRIARHISGPCARKALQEMSNIVVYFASEMGRTPSHPLAA